MDFGIPFLLETGTAQSCLELCKELDLQFVEWNMNFPQCQISNLDLNQLNDFRIKNGIYYSLHLDENFNICDFNRDVRRAYLNTMADAINAAKEIKAPIINMHLAKGISVTLPTKKEFLFAVYKEQYLSDVLEFRKLCQRLIGDAQIKISVENTDGFAQHEQEALELLLESPCFGLTLDIGHSHAAGDIDMGFYHKHINRLIHMHAHDAKGTRNHLAFGDGELDLKQKLGMAEAANARVVLETKTIEALKKTKAWLNVHSAATK